MQGVLGESRASCRLSIISRAGSSSDSQQQQYEGLVDNSWRWLTSTASSAPNAVPRVPGWGPGECGLVRDRFSLCTQQLNWCALDESSLIVSYVMGTAAVGLVILDYCIIVLHLNPNHTRYQVITCSRSDLKLCLQPLALILLKLWMIKVAVSNWSSKKYVMKLFRFESHKIIMFFCLLWKGPIFEPQKILHNTRPYAHAYVHTVQLGTRKDLYNSGGQCKYRLALILMVKVALRFRPD